MIHNSYALPGGAVAATGRARNSRLSRSTVTSIAGEVAPFCRIATYSRGAACRVVSRATRPSPKPPRGPTRRSLPPASAPRSAATPRLKHLETASSQARRRPNARLDRGEIVARRLDRRRGLGERREALLPGADRFVELRLAQPPSRECGAFARAERAEREFGGGELVFGPNRHDAKQSLS